MVTELDKTSMEVALKTLSMDSQTPPSIDGISYGKHIYMDDLDAKEKGANVVQIGMSLAGGLAEMNAALAGNENIETYTFNSCGTRHLATALQDAGYTLSNDYSNIHNFRYRNELLSVIGVCLGNS